MALPTLTEINTTPREYRLRVSLKVVYLLLAAVLLTGAGLVINLAIRPNARPFGSYFLFAGVLLALLALFLVLLVLRSRLVLVGDWIEVYSALGASIANRSEIEGFRKMQSRNSRWTRIYLQDGRGAFNVPEWFNDKNDLNEWLKAVPDLDQRDIDQIWQQLRDQHPPGTTDDEIRIELKQAKAWSAGLSIASFIAGFVALLANYEPLYTASIVLLLIFPPLGFLLAHLFPLLFTCADKPDPRANLWFMVIWSGFLLAISYLGNHPVRLANYSQLIPWALPVFLFFSVALFRTTRGNPDRWYAFVLLVIFGAAYSFGLAATANTLPDRSPPRLYRAYVLEKFTTYGKGPVYHLRLARWGPVDNADDVVVPMRMYQQVSVRDLMCIELHPGFLHVPWYTLAPCSE